MYNYVIKIVNSQFYKKIAVFFYFSFILSLFFPIRHIFFTKEAYATGQYSDFTSFSSYLSDILLFITWFLTILPRGGEFYSKIKAKLAGQNSFKIHDSKFIILVFWLILALILHFSRTSLYWTFKWLELIVAYETTRIISNGKFPAMPAGRQITNFKQSFFQFFSLLCGIQSIIAIYQFFYQRPLGLNKLGEQLINPHTVGFAKIIVSGETLVRGYGTFPHPNLLSAFLVAGLLMSIYLLQQAKNVKSSFYYSLLILLNTLGLTVTFSRAAFFAYAIGLIIYFGYQIFSYCSNKSSNFTQWKIIHSINKKEINTIIVMVIVIFSIVLSLLVFRPYLLTRATIGDNAVSERITYNHIGLQIIKANPLFGVGAGESVLHMQQYSENKLKPWEIQPIHNYFLIAGAELGLPGALILILILLSHLKLLWLSINNKELNMENHQPLLLSILLVFIVLMFFDHYFYTLQQTQMLLWVILGLIAEQTHQQTTKVTNF